MLRIRGVVQRPDGARFLLSHDPLDEQILLDTYGTFAPLFFPRGLEAFPPDAWILDVGAHHGIYAVAALHRYPRSRLIAVEPDPDGVTLLRDNLAINGFQDRAEIVHGSVATQDGRGLLERSRYGSWANRMVAAPGGDPVVMVRTFRLESILNGRKPFLVKCNCEGGEFEVIPQLFTLGILPPWIILLVHPQEGPGDELVSAVARQGYGVTPVCSTPPQPRFVCRLP